MDTPLPLPGFAEVGRPARTTARARRTDPPTSHAAAASVRDLTGAQAFVLAMVEALGPVTDEQLADAYVTVCSLRDDAPRLSPSGLRTRRAELVRAGKLRNAGQLRRTASGRRSIVWEAVAK